MSTDLLAPEHNLLATLAGIADKANDFANNSKAANTIRGYRSDWQQFSEWCRAHGQCSLPASPECMACYLADLAAKRKPATLARHMAAISQVHQMAGFESPTQASKVRLVMAGIRRTKGTAQAAKIPVLVPDLRRMLSQVPGNLTGVRDRALLLLGFAGAFRRSELVQVDFDSILFLRQGLVVTIRRSKTDQEGIGRKVGVPYGSNLQTCPIRSLQDWLDHSGLKEGPLFRPINRHGQIGSRRLSGAAVARIVKRYVNALGLDAVRYGGHSLRSGLATSAALAGASEASIMSQTGHRSLSTVRVYIRSGSLFCENAAAVVGL